MAAKLTYQIPQSNFETVRSAIAALLKVEMDNQAILRGTAQTPPLPVIPNPDYTAAFYTDRFEPVDNAEGNVIVVTAIGGQLDNQTPKSQSFECVFDIDIFTGAKETSAGQGYYNSTTKLNRLAGLVRHILQSPYFDRLGMANNIVERRSVSSIRFARVNDEQDTAFQRMGRVSLTVRIYEESSEITPITAGGYDTIINIAETEEGYLLTYNNTKND